MNIFLIGYRGTGKSTVAERLSAKTQMPWIDADESIETLAGTSIKEIFSKQGESAFRELETTVLENLRQRDGWILALGGGVIVRSQNRRILSQTNPVFWLTAQVGTIRSRLAADPVTDQRRPALTATGGVTEIKEMLAQREPLYRQCADHIVPTDDRTADAVADQIIELLLIEPHTQNPGD
ncbi:MAG: shikimate kinase [Planctomycetaceae bacterium]|nr:shikimate kinase [Planctomycetaceae bacterium]